MAQKLVTVLVFSKKQKKHIEVTYPMDEGLYEGICTLPDKQQKKYFKHYYREYNRMKYRQSNEVSLFDKTVLEQCDSIHFEDPKAAYEKKERYEALENALQQLSPRQRYIIHEVYFSNRKHKEVAEELGMKISTFSMALSKTLDDLKYPY